MLSTPGRRSDRSSYRSRRWPSFFAALGAGGTAFALGALMLFEPHEAMEAALRGVAVWWEVLFPALFPFFVLSELLLGFGIVHLAGTLLDPYMRPLFRLPGIGGFIVAMGFASGYPVGARLTSRLMEQGQLNRDEGERLVAITTTSDPIFLIGAVCIGFFGNPQAAPALAVAHYGSALLLGLLLRFRANRSEGGPASSVRESKLSLRGAEAKAPRRSRLWAAFAAMHRARLADGRPLGLLLRQSLESSVRLIVIVGGLVVFFSVVMELLLQSGVLAAARHAVGDLLRAFGMRPELAPSLVNGVFEVTLGARTAGTETTSLVPMVDRIAAAAFILSWAGLSVHAQVAGLMSGTTWRYAPFARARLLHAIGAAVLVYIVWPWLGSGADTSAASMIGGPSDLSVSAIPWPLYALLLPFASLALMFAFAAAGAVSRILSGRRD